MDTASTSNAVRFGFKLGLGHVKDFFGLIVTASLPALSKKG